MISPLLLACFNMRFPLRYHPLPFGEENRFAVSCLTLLGVAQSTSRFHAALERYIVVMLFSKMFFWFRSVKTQNLTPNCSHPIFSFDFFRLPVWLVSVHLKPSETTTKSQSSTAAQDGCGAMSPATFLIWPAVDSKHVPKLATCKIPMAHWHFVILWWSKGDVGDFKVLLDHPEDTKNMRISDWLMWTGNRPVMRMIAWFILIWRSGQMLLVL